MKLFGILFLAALAVFFFYFGHKQQRASLTWLGWFETALVAYLVIWGP